MYFFFIAAPPVYGYGQTGRFQTFSDIEKQTLMLDIILVLIKSEQFRIHVDFLCTTFHPFMPVI